MLIQRTVRRYPAPQSVQGCVALLPNVCSDIQLPTTRAGLFITEYATHLSQSTPYTPAQQPSEDNHTRQYKESTGTKHQENLNNFRANCTRTLQSKPRAVLVPFGRFLFWANPLLVGLRGKKRKKLWGLWVLCPGSGTAALGVQEGCSNPSHPGRAYSYLAGRPPKKRHAHSYVYVFFLGVMLCFFF